MFPLILKPLVQIASISLTAIKMHCQKQFLTDFQSGHNFIQTKRVGFLCKLTDLQRSHNMMT